MKQRLIAKITTVLQHLPVVRNLARQKFVSQFIIALLKSRNVPFCEVAQHLNDAVKPASNETRIQDFFRETDLNYFVLAHLLLSLLPAQARGAALTWRPLPCAATGSSASLWPWSI